MWWTASKLIQLKCTNDHLEPIVHLNRIEVESRSQRLNHVFPIETTHSHEGDSQRLQHTTDYNT